MAAFAIRVGVALPFRGAVGAPQPRHSAVARLDLACLVAGWIVQIRLDGRFCASQPTGDLGDRQTLLVAVVAGELRRAAPFLGRASEPEAYRRCWTARPSARDDPYAGARSVESGVSARGIRRSFGSSRRIVEVRLDRRRRATQAVGDLPDRETLELAVMARQGNRPAALNHPIRSRLRHLGRHFGPRYAAPLAFLTRSTINCRNRPHLLPARLGGHPPGGSRYASRH
jgi:hypothetical protein